MTQPSNKVSSLLHALSSSSLSPQRDGENVGDKDECTFTLQEYLQKCSQHIPSQPVKDLLSLWIKDSENDTSGVKLDTCTLRIAYGQLLTGPLDRFRSSSSTSSLWDTLQDFIPVLFFLQFLLELCTTNRCQSSTCSKPLDLPIPVKDLHEMAFQLLRNISGVLCRFLEEQNKECAHDENNNDAEDKEEVDVFYDRVFRQENIAALMSVNNYDCRRIVIFFVWQFLLRISDSYIPAIPKFLSPFWRALSETATAMQTLPEGLSMEAIKSLLQFLRQGNLNFLRLVVSNEQHHANISQPQQSSQSPSSSSQLTTNVVALRLKTLTFFVNRLHFFLHRLPSVSATKNHRLFRICSYLLEQLAVLRGVEMMVLTFSESDKENSNVCFLLSLAEANKQDIRATSEKAQKCFQTLYKHTLGFKVVTEGMIIPSLRSDLNWIRQDENGTIGTTRCLRELAQDILGLGKASFLNQVLLLSSKDTFDKKDIDETEKCILLTTRAMLFQALPVCLKVQHRQLEQRTRSDGSETNTIGCCDRFVVETIPILVQAFRFLLSERDGEQMSRLHRLVISWLGMASSEKTGHPFVLEVLTQVILHSNLPHDSANNKLHHNSASAFCHLLVHLLMDCRINQSLRITVANLLRRIFLYGHGMKDNMTASAMSALTDPLCCCLAEKVFELTHHFKSTSDRHNKKQQRKRRRLHAPPQQTVTFLNPIDLSVVGPVLLLVPQHYFQKVLPALELQHQKTIKPRDWRIATLSIYCDRANRPLSSEVCSSLQSKPSLDATFFTVALFQRRVSYQLHGDQNLRLAPPVEMSNSEAEHFLSLISQIAEYKNEVKPSSLYLQVTGALALANIGRTMPPNPSDQVLGLLAPTFQKMFSFSSGLLNKVVVSAFCIFSSHVPDRYKHTLPACLPSLSKPNVQAHLKKKPYIPHSYLGQQQKSQDQSVVRVLLIRRYHEGLIRFGQPVTDFQRHFSCLFPAPSSLTIPNGSYVLTMPTQQGRNATVIFPPGPDSIADISFMLGECDENDNDSGDPSTPSVPLAPIYTLKRIHILRGNGGCNLLLHQKSLHV
ncbi:hypothetical protein ACA910_011031 [Epithemia clementina (nom. ined.)]